jgi:L-asparaginase
MRHITLITTGGTIEKTYDEQTGSLENRRSIVGRMLRRLRLEDATVRCVELMSKDSLVMTDDDRRQVVEAVRAAGGAPGLATDTTGIVVLHGTDTLSLTGERLVAAIPSPRVPIVLTGAWRPYEMTRSDALQNLTESLFAAGVLPPGVYAVAHGRALRFPGVVKDRARRTFVAGGAA